LCCCACGDSRASAASGGCVVVGGGGVATDEGDPVDGAGVVSSSVNGVVLLIAVYLADVALLLREMVEIVFCWRRKCFYCER
jgi:hypothetical protein